MERKQDKSKSKIEMRLEPDIRAQNGMKTCVGEQSEKENY